MKRLLFLLLLPAFSFAQTGSISGNAFYHYNDFVGDKPEAGASVYLLDDAGKTPAITQCDVQGNYHFDKIKPGRYMIMVISSNTYDDGNYILGELRSQQGGYAKFLGFDITDIEACYDSIAILDSAFTKIASQKMTVWNSKKIMKQMDAATKAIHDQTRHAVDEAYNRMSFWPKAACLGMGHKIYFETLSVYADESKTVISNFGISSR